MNTSTGATTLVTTASIIGVTQNLAFSPAGVLYGSESVSLYTIDLTTGVATFVGGPRYPPDDNGLAFAPDGTLYAVGGPLDPVEDVYRINPSNDAVSTINSSTPCWVGLTFATDGNLYCTGTNATIASKLYQIDPTTGAATLVFDTGLNIGDLANTAVPAVPAPATLLLLGAGLIGLAGTAWRGYHRG